MTDDLERRLRAALAARADRVTLTDLRPSVPPTMAVAHRRAFPLRAVLLATALVLVVVALIPWLRPDPALQQPASPPSSVPGTVCAPYTVGAGQTPPRTPCPIRGEYPPSTSSG
jgi:hypothetical protein